MMFRLTSVVLATLVATGSALAQKPAGKPNRENYANYGEWSVDYLTNRAGKFVEAQATRFWDDNTALRVTMSAKKNTIDWRGKGAANQGDPFSVRYSWAAGKSVKADPASATDTSATLVKDDGGMTWARVEESTEDGPGSIDDALANAQKLVIEAENAKWSYDLTKSLPAIRGMIKCYQEAPGASQVPAQSTGAKTEAASEDSASEGERVVLTKAAPSTRWDVKVKPDESKIYVIPVKKGQTISVSFLEDTKQGNVDLGKFSLEEGLISEDKGISFKSDETTDYRLSLGNPTRKALTFTVYVTVK